jgi:hypothetical protein
MTKDPRVYLAHILERMDRISQYTVSGRDVFFKDLMMQDAVVRNFEIIGEVVQVAPDWRSCGGCRPKYVDYYEGSVLRIRKALLSANANPAPLPSSASPPCLGYCRFGCASEVRTESWRRVYE